MSYEGDLVQHYAEVRQRLYRSSPQPVKPRRIAYSPPAIPAPSAEPEPAPAQPVRVTILGCIEVTEGPSRRRHWSRIAGEVAEKHGVSIRHLRSPLRVRNICAARHELVWRLREELDWSWGQIGKLLNRDHTTVLSSWRAHQASMDKWMSQ